jgi:hypothetical protein
MPKIRTLRPEEVPAKRQNVMDLSIYRDYLEQAEVGEMGAIELEPEDNQRAVKRRMTIAAGMLGLQIKWRSTSTDQILYFKLQTPQPVKHRKPKDVVHTPSNPDQPLAQPTDDWPPEDLGNHLAQEPLLDQEEEVPTPLPKRGRRSATG